MVEPPTPSLVFEVLREGYAPALVTIAKPVIKIGRHERAHLVLADEAVARMHAVIEVTADAIVVIDLGNDAGTFVNDQRVNKASLRVGDVLGIGPFRVRLARVTPVGGFVDPAPKPPAPVRPAEPPRRAPPPPDKPRVPHCSRCGERLGDAPLGTGGHAYRELPIRALRCSSCAVTYVDVATLEQKLRRSVRITGTAAERSRKRGGGRCPLCADALERVSLEWAGTWATVEECCGCGLLALDSGELAVIERLAAAAAG
jgi:hypothetical protein